MARQDIKLDGDLGCPEESKAKTQIEICKLTFTAVLVTTARRQKKPKCPSMGEWLKKMWYTHIHTLTHTGILFSHEKLRNFNTCSNMANLKTWCYMKGARQKRINIVWFYLGWRKRFGNRWWWLHNIVSVLNTADFCTYKWFKMMQFYLMSFTTIFQKKLVKTLRSWDSGFAIFESPTPRVFQLRGAASQKSAKLSPCTVERL